MDVLLTTSHATFTGNLATKPAKAKGASQGALFDDGLNLSQLIKRPTTPLAQALQQALDHL